MSAARREAEGPGVQWRGWSILRLLRERKSTAALLFALLIIPILGLVGIAIDYGLWNETEATLALAVNSAASNAVKVAAAADLAQDSNFLLEGQAAGVQWFNVSIGQGNKAATVTAISPVVTLTAQGSTISANVTVTATIQSIFGVLFNVGYYNLSVAAAASVNTAPYLNVELLLDTSASMEVAATPLDVAAMLLIVPCSIPGNSSTGTAATTYDGFAYTVDGVYKYTPPTVTGWWPLILPGSPPVTLTPTGAPTGPSCNGATNGVHNATAGTPCAFACHYDTSKPAGAGSDLYGLARSTIGKPACSQALTAAQLSNCEIQLRIDVLKESVKNVITTMESDNTSQNNLQVGVWNFDTSLYRVYPPSGEAGNDFATASASVGSAPTTPNGPDTGIQPYVGVVRGGFTETNINGALESLSGTLTPAGSGATQASARKVLILITDGYQSSAGPIAPSYCTTFKNMGYTVYVVYTTYYISPHTAALSSASLVMSAPGSTATPPIPAALQSCASSTADYIEATDQAGLTTALNTFLKAALTAPITFTK